MVHSFVMCVLTDFLNMIELKFELQLRGAQAAISGELASSSVTVKLDRSMNNMPFRCEAENGAIDEPLVATKAINILCKFLFH